MFNGLWDFLEEILREPGFLARPTRHASSHSRVSWRHYPFAYPLGMDKDEHLQRHLDLCRRVYRRMLADGSWPWKDELDSTETESVIESEDIPNDV